MWIRTEHRQTVEVKFPQMDTPTSVAEDGAFQVPDSVATELLETYAHIVPHDDTE